MKLISIKKLKITHFILFIGVILTIILFLNNSNFSNQMIHNDQEHNITPKTSASTVTINSPEALLYGASPLLINATIISGNVILDVKANINDTIPFNISMSNGGSGDHYTCLWSNITDYVSGDYNITIIAIDDEPSVNMSQSVVITIDRDGPGVSIDEPADLSSHNNDATIEINATVTDPGSGVAGAKAMLNSTLGDFNLTMQEVAGTWTVIWTNTSLYAEGDYNITIWAIDGKGNVNETEFVVITLNDVINPSVSIDEPANLSSYDTDASIEINATITDPGSGVVGAKAMINSTLGDFNLTMQEVAGTWTVIWVNTSLYTEGDHKITIWVIDGAGNVNQSEFVTITREDLTKPFIYFIIPNNNTIVTNDVNITVRIIDANAPNPNNVIALIYNGTPSDDFNLTMVRIGTSNYWTVIWDNISDYYSEGDYFINITAIDSSLNQNRNSTGFLNITFRYDTVAPRFSFPPGLNNTIITSVPFNIEVNITDNYSTPGQIDVIIEFSTNPWLFNASMDYVSENTWRFSWTNISSYSNGVYKIQIHAIDSSSNRNSNSSLIFTLTLNLSSGGGNGPGGFNLLDFLLSPPGLIMIAAIIIAIIALTIIIMARRRGHRTSIEERDRIERLTGESLCERCEYFDAEEEFCNKLLVIKRFNLNAPCKDYKRKSIASEVAKAKEEAEEKFYEPVPGTACETCQYFNYKTGLCDKYLTYPQLKPDQFCKGFKKIKDEGDKVKVSAKGKSVSIKLLGPDLCAVCQFQELDTGFCKKFLTYKKLKPNESCKGFKKRKENEET